MSESGKDIETDIDSLEAEEEGALEVPADRRQVKTEKQDLPVETVASWVKRGRLNLQPEFQRMYVWKRATASRLIESLLLSIPIPVIYLVEEADKTYAVVDGQQRLTSICAFIDGKLPGGQEFRLRSLQVLSDLNAKAFRDLPEVLQETILGAVLRVITISHDSHPDVRFEVFERLNLGSVKLNDQELRNCMFRGKYNELLGDLVLNSQLRKILGSQEPEERMKDRQLILRFFAMWRNTHLKYRSPMKRFLNREMESNRNPDTKAMADMRTVFERCIDMAYLVFGRHAFRRFSPGRKSAVDGAWEGKLNIALWDTVLYSFSFYEKRDIVPIADRVREESLDLVTNDARFVDFVSRTTDKTEAVVYRASAWRQRLDELVSAGRSEPRGFTLEAKRQMFQRNPTCQICSQRIHDIDDSEIDHIEHYWRGGRTIPENARLTHRYCNRARSGREW